MIRVLVFLALIGVLALGAGWLADRPGMVMLDWQGTRVETSLVVAAAALAALVVALLVVIGVVRFILGGPGAFSDFLRGRRRLRGRRAIARGLVAVGVGDARGARRAAYDAARLAPEDPLTLLLRAQSAQLSADQRGAGDAFRAMLDNPETRALGYRGLFIEAQRRGDALEARRLADEAVRQMPEVGWAGQALFDLQCAQRDWDGALATVERNLTNKAIDRKAAKHQRAVLLTAKAWDGADHAPDHARRAAVEAVGLEPHFVPAAAIAGRLLAEAGETRRASKVVEVAWKAQPHPDLAEAYLHARHGDTAQDRLKRARVLFERATHDPESRLTLSRAALEARDFKLARETLQPLMQGSPTRRACLLMAEIEHTEHGDEGITRAWVARAVGAPRDPAWVADGTVSDTWSPISPVTGRLDAYRWQVPQEQLAPPDKTLLEETPAAATPESLPAPPPLIVEAPPAPPAAPEPAPPPPAAAIAAAAPAKPVEPLPAPVEQAPAKAQPQPMQGPNGSAGEIRPPRKPARPREVVMPIARLPDDPGPDEAEAEFDAPRRATTIPGGP